MSLVIPIEKALSSSWVGNDDHEAGAGAELGEELLEGGRAMIEGKGVGGVLRGDALAGEVAGSCRGVSWA